MNLRHYTCALLLTAAPAWSVAFAADPPIEAFAPLASDESQTAVLPPDSAASATELSAAPICHPTKRRAALVALHWRPAGAPDQGNTPPREGIVSTHQRVELTKFREGFRTGRLKATRRLTATAEAVAVDSPETGIHYYWRVLTLTSGGWAPSAVGRFEVPVCPWDEPDLSRFEAVLNDDPPNQKSPRR